MDIRHQYDCKGNHRIVIKDDRITTIGDPFGYSEVAFVNHSSRWYAAITPYYEGVLPHEMCEGVFELTKVGYEDKEAGAYNFYRPDEICPFFAREGECSHTKCPQMKES